MIAGWPAGLRLALLVSVGAASYGALVLLVARDIVGELIALRPGRG